MLSGRRCPVLSVRFGWGVAPMWPHRSIQRPHPYHSCCRAPVLEDAEVKWPGVSMADRGEPVASCSEWHGDGTGGEDDPVSYLAADGTSSGDGRGPSKATPAASLASRRRSRGSSTTRAVRSSLNLRRRAVQGRSSWIDVPPYAARCRFVRRLSVHSGRKRQGVTRSLPLLIYSAPGGLRQDPGRVAESPPKPEPAEIRESRSTCALVDVWVSAGRRTAGGTRGAVAHSVRRCRCARRRTARSSWPRCNLVEWGVSCLT